MSCSMINSIGTQILQILAVLFLKLLVDFFTRMTEPDSIKSKKDKSNSKIHGEELAKIKKMLENEIDIKKSEEENSKKQNKGAYKYLKRLNDFLCVEFFCNFFMAIQLDVLLGACLAIQNAEFSSVIRIIDLLLALIVLGAYVSFLFFIIRMTYKIMTSDKDKLLKRHYKTKFKNWLFIVDPLVEIKEDREKKQKKLENGIEDSQQVELKEETEGTKNKKKPIRGKDFLIPYFLFSQILKDFLIAPILVFSVTFSPGQIIPIIAIFISSLIMQLVLKPLKDKRELYTLIINDFLYILALTNFLLYHFQQNNLTEQQKYYRYGFSIIGILCAIIGVNLIIGFYVFIAQVKNLCMKKSVKKNQLSALKSIIRRKTLNKRKKKLQKVQNKKLSLQDSEEELSKNNTGKVGEMEKANNAVDSSKRKKQIRKQELKKEIDKLKTFSIRLTKNRVKRGGVIQNKIKRKK